MHWLSKTRRIIDIINYIKRNVKYKLQISNNGIQVAKAYVIIVEFQNQWFF